MSKIPNGRDFYSKIELLYLLRLSDQNITAINSDFVTVSLQLVLLLMEGPYFVASMLSRIYQKM